MYVLKFIYFTCCLLCFCLIRDDRPTPIFKPIYCLCFCFALFFGNCFNQLIHLILMKYVRWLYKLFIIFPSTDYPIFHFLKNESFSLIWNYTFIIFWIFASPSILKLSSFWTMLPFASVILDFLTLLQHKENLRPLDINLCLSPLFWTKYLSFFSSST